MAEVLAKQPRPRGPAPDDRDQRRRPRRARHRRADRQRRRAGRAVAETHRGARTASCPPHWSHNNPIDILGDAGPERYAKALEIAAKDPNSDGLLVILTPQAMTDPTADRRAAQAATPSIDGKPVLASWMGGADVAAGEAILNQRRHPDLPLPRHRRPRLQLHVALQLQPARPVRDARRCPRRSDDGDAGPRRGRGDRSQASATAGRTLLTEVESKQLLAAYGIPTVADARRRERGRGGRGGRRRSATRWC